MCCRAGVSAHRGIIGGDVNQDLRGAPPTHVSVAVPYAANQVGLKNNKNTHTQQPSSASSSLHTITDAALSYSSRRANLQEVGTRDVTSG